jgi:YjbE family integral membrane protein
MDGAAAASTFGILVQILFLDLLLSGDNALLIALACRRLPPEQARRAAWLGAAGAILLRLVLTLMTSAIMSLPFLQLLSALPLLTIALNLMNGEDEEIHEADSEQGQATMLAAAGVIIVSDLVMSLDNVVALAAVSGGRFWLLALGLAFSIPLIVFGSFGFSHLMRSHPWIGDLGAAMLGWVAGGMVVADPALAGWVRTQAPALDLAVPLACAIFVLVQGRFARDRARAEAALRPPPQPRPKAPPKPTPQTPAPPKPAPTKPAPQRVATPEAVMDPPAALPLQGASAQGESAPAETGPGDESSDPTDRWMVIGLLALFLIFGLFLTIVVMIPD